MNRSIDPVTSGRAAGDVALHACTGMEEETVVANVLRSKLTPVPPLRPATHPVSIMDAVDRHGEMSSPPIPTNRKQLDHGNRGSHVGC
jgi:hypothetical protein